MTEVLLQEEPKQNGDIPLSVDTDNQNQQNLLNGSSSKRRSTSVDPDAEEMLISSLRTQIQDLVAQVSLLNSKLVKSYDRVSDLEDDLHVASANLRSSSLKISYLELERTQHLSALNTGLLVEKSHVTTELNRLMEKATEEAAQRGQAESARIAIEKELDDLSASLFDQANTMVAEARFAKHLSERKVEDAERALRSAEEAVQLMQVQMQAMQAEKEETEQRSQKMEMVVNKGKWVERGHDDISISLRLLNSHWPYQDYLAFLSHLRVLHLTSPSPPAMTTLLPLPFLARLLNEDSEPTVRLDLAPSLNWLSRRSVLAAIHSGQLTIEPISAASLFAESTSYQSSTTIAGVNSSNDNISCALCNSPIFPVTESNRSPTSPYNVNPSSWSGSFFKRTTSMGYIVNSRPPSPPHPTTTLSSIDSTAQIYIFKLASLPTSTIPSLPISSLSKSSSQSTSSSIPLLQSASIYNGLPSASPNNNQSVTIYPLCRTGWCLSRLRTTCTLWAFVRTGIVDKVWEEVVNLPTPPPVPNHATTTTITAEKPSLPPRKRGLWGIASAIGERAVSWSEGDKDKTKKQPPPPVLNNNPQEQSKLSPLVSQHRDPTTPIAVGVPPPLPKRNRNPAMTSPLPHSNIDNPTNTQTVSTASTTVPSSNTTTVSSSTTTVPSSTTTVPSSTISSSTTTVSSSTTAVPSSPLAVAPSSVVTPVHARTSSSSSFPAPPERSSMRTSLLIDRTLTPSNIPLPDSRPSTPPVAPSRTTSPAAIGNSSGAPPPLPRRAANRGVRGTAANVSRSGTPVNGPESAIVAQAPSATEKTSVVNSTTTKADEKVDDKPNGNDNNNNNIKNGDPASSNMIVADHPSRSPDILVVDVAGPKSNEDVQADVGEPVQQKKGVEEDSKTMIDLSVVPSFESTAVNGLDNNPDEAKTNNNNEEINYSNHNHVNGVVAVKDDEEKEEEKVDSEAALETEETDKGQYVGDGSWEEKTWKELVRLREDMFWARVGGFRC